MNESKVIAFFDFDGTITKRDIFWDYILYRLKNGLSVFKIAACGPTLLKFFLKLTDNETAKQKVFGYLFRGERLDSFENSVTDYFTNYFHRQLRSDAMARLQWHKDQQHIVCVVSANFDLLIKRFADEQNIIFLSTQVEVADNAITGRFATPNCYGPEKIRRIKAAFTDIESYETYAYGDSRGDREMLDLCKHKFYKYFNS